MTSVLKVDNIQNSSGTDAISIDSSGVVTRPVIPAWRQQATHADLTASGDYDIVWKGSVDAESADNRRFLFGGCTLEDSNVTVKVPVTGLYQINVNARVDEIGSGYVWLQIRVNDSVVHDSSTIEGTASTSYQGMNVHAIYHLVANDKVRIVVGTSADTSWELDGSNTFFSGALIG